MSSVNRFTKVINNVWRYTFSWLLANIRAKTVKPYLKGDILDIGCGGEYSLTTLLDKGQRYVGIDIQEELIQRLRQTKPSYKFYCLDIEVSDDVLLETINSQFDTIVMLAVIEHLQNPCTILSQCRTLLKPSGNLVITTPTVKGDKLIRFIKAVLGVKQEEEEGYGPHMTSFNEETLISLLAVQNGFKVKLYRKFEFGFNQLIIVSL